ncbi:MAG: hypothetical protein Q4D16_09230 [Eubacteriales bacterium]|nr:hypothetical protein [Eubacteriales bacterium]
MEEKTVMKAIAVENIFVYNNLQLYQSIMRKMQIAAVCRRIGEVYSYDYTQKTDAEYRGGIRGHHTKKH